MRLQQVISGAANDKANAVVVGRIRGIPVLVYARAFNVVILHGDDFSMVQMIPQPDNCEDVISCVSWSAKGGRIAAAYGTKVVIYDPVPDPDNQKLPYKWVMKETLDHDSTVHAISISADGCQMVTGSDSLRLYKGNITLFHGTNDSDEDDDDDSSDGQSSGAVSDGNESDSGNDAGKSASAADKDKKGLQRRESRVEADPWTLEWECQMAKPVFYLKFSPDGKFFAAAGKYDRLVKVWWRTEGDNNQPGRFTFVYLPHSRAVTGFQWRDQSAMSSKRFNNAAVLLTASRDHVTRIWTGLAGWSKDLLHFHLAATIGPEKDKAAGGGGSMDDSTSVASGVTLGSSHAYEGHHIGSFPISLIPGREMCMSVTLKESLQEKELLQSAKTVTKFQRRKSQWHAAPDPKTAQKGKKKHASHSCTDLPDFAVGIQPDGTLVVWQIDGVDEQPRCIPRVNVAARLADAVPPQEAHHLSFEILAFSATETKKLIHLSGDEASVNCLPSELILVARNANGSIGRWRLHLKESLGHVQFTRLELDTRSTGHTTKIKHVKSHPELGLVLTMGQEQTRDRGELVAWAVQPVRVMDTTFAPLTAVTRMKHPGKWDPSLMSWFPHRPTFLAVSEGKLGIWTITVDPRTYGRDRQSYGDVDLNAVIEEATPHCANMMSVHVFAVKDEGNPPAETPVLMDATRYYVVALLNDGRSILVWQVALTDDTRIARTMLVGGGAHELDMPAGAKITYLTRPFTTRLQHRHEFVGAEAKEDEDALLLVSACDDGIVRLWQCLVDRNNSSASEGVNWINIVSSTNEKGLKGAMSVKAAASWQMACKFSEGPASNTVVVWECFTSGGQELKLEDTISFPIEERIFSYDWMDTGDGATPLLAIGAGTKVHLYAHLTTVIYQPSQVKWEMIHSFDVAASSPGASPRSFRWTQDGSLIVGCEDRTIVYSKWLDKHELARIKREFRDQLYVDLENDMPGSVFELANALDRPLPQYHPRQLYMLVMSNWFERANAIIIHLGQCLQDAMIKYEVDKEAGRVSASDIPTLDFTPFLPIVKWSKVVDAQKKTYIPKGVNEQEAEAQAAIDPNLRRKSVFPLAGTEPATNPDDPKDATYNELFSYNFDDPVSLDDGAAGGERAKGPVTLDKIIEYLQTVRVPGITPYEQVSLMGQLDTMREMGSLNGGLDACGIRGFFGIKLFCYLRHQAPQSAPSHVSSSTAFWMLHSESQEALLEMLLSKNMIGMTWDDFRAIRFGLWIKSPTTLRDYAEKIAREKFKLTHQPLEAALFFIALGKKSMLLALCKSIQDTKLTTFFANDFSEERWQTAASKNAYVLMGRQQFMQAAAFFLLADKLEDAVNICVKNLGDYQLGLVICRLAEGENGPMFQKILREMMIPHNQATHNAPMLSICHWLLKQYPEALDALLGDPAERTKLKEDVSAAQSAALVNMPTGTTSLSEQRARAALGSAADNQYIKQRTEQMAGQRKFSIKDAEKPAPEYYDPVICECIQWIKNHVLLREKRLDTAKFIRRICESIYASYHAGCHMTAIDRLQLLKEKAEDLKKERSAPKEDPAVVAARQEMVHTGAVDFSSFGFDDFAEPEEKAPVAVAPTAEATEDADASDLNEGLERMFTLMTDEVSHDMGLRVIIRDIEQWRGESLWSVSGENIRADVQQLIDQYNVSGTGSGGSSDEGSTGVEAMLQALHFYYRMHNDLSYEVKMLGVEGLVDRIYGTMMEAERNIVLGIPHATYLRPPQTLFRTSAVMWEEERKDSIMYGRASIPAAGRDAEAAKEAIAAAKQAAQEEADVDVYLLQLFRKSAFALSDALHQVLVNDLPEAPYCDKLRSAVFASETYLVVFAGLFCSSWWRKDLGQMQALLMNAPNKDAFYKLFKKSATRHMNVHDVLKREVSVTSADGNNLHTSRDFLEGCVEETDPDKNPVHLASFLLTVDPDAMLEYDDFGDADETGYESDTSNLSAKLLDEIFRKPARVLSAIEKRELREKEEYIYGVLRLACVQYVTLSLQTFLGTMGVDFDELASISPLLFRVLGVFEAWTLQAQMYLKGLKVPRNVLGLDNYEAEGDALPKTTKDFKVAAITDPGNNPFKGRSKVLSRLWNFMTRQENVRGIMIRLLFWEEEFTAKSLNNEDGKVLYEDKEAILSFCINQVDGIGLATATPKGGHHFKEGALNAPKSKGIKGLFKGLHRSNSKSSLKSGEEGAAPEKDKESAVKKLTKKLSKTASKSNLLQTPGQEGTLIQSMAEMLPPKLSAAEGLSFKALDPTVASSTTNLEENLRKRGPGLDAYDSGFTGVMETTSSQLSLNRQGSDQRMMTPSPTPGSKPVARGKKSNVVHVRLESHPNMPYYMSGSNDGRIQLWQFGLDDVQYEYEGIGTAKITQLHFDMFGNSFGITDQSGNLGLWRFGSSEHNAKPFKKLKAHTKTATDLAYLNSETLLATGGQSSESRNVCLWDTLQADSKACVKAFQCHQESYCTSLVCAPGRNQLIAGSKKGKLCVIDIRQMRILHEFQAHDGAINAMCMDTAEESLFTGSSDGTIKIFNLQTYEEKNSFMAHMRPRSFLLGGDQAGVTEMYYMEDFLFSSGADGTVRRWG